LNAAVPLDTWQAICKKAADDALAGDAKAREWLLGLEARVLTTLAAEEVGAGPATAAEQEIRDRRHKLADDRQDAAEPRALFRTFG
jgi:hypothetical protein